jgi:acyl-CoA thioester hydrolase
MEEKIHKINIQMRYVDLDALGHVNNAVYLTYFELGRTKYFLDKLGGFISTDVHFVVVHAEIEFKSPARFEDNLVVETWISQIGNSSCTFSHKILNNEKTFAYGKTVVVWIDDNFHKTPIDSILRKILSDNLVE